MTDAELAELVAHCPVLYHATLDGSWPMIARYGLLSTSALLDKFEVAGPARAAIEDQRRPAIVTLAHPAHGAANIRDQHPMDDAGLRRCLTGGMQPFDWYRLLNGKVFFWLSRARLERLLSARAYRDLSHDVLELDTASLIAAHADAITLCPINSGTSFRKAAPRGPESFLSLNDYPYAAWRRRRARGERAVELTVAYHVPDAMRFVRRVTMRRGAQELKLLYEA